MNDQGTREDVELRQAWADANAADAAEQTREARPGGPADRDDDASSAPFWATVLAVLVIPVAVLFGSLAPMATDSCGPDNCSGALDGTLAVVKYSLFTTVIGTPVLLLASWLLPRRIRYAKARKHLAWCALLPPVIVILLVLGLPE
ncbi:hypothetical protein [Streptomyces roseifaciens]|uniref:hypothetical protein n=1 Tax=Streptomyces roseifaciens TaxID=1488406 RepID=UPI000A97A281|nr:hypothetical protein [Streptomyces roseifaciens]